MSKGMFGDMMKQAKKLQQEMGKVQEETKRRTVEATVGGGMVTVTANGAMEILSIKIEREVVNPDDIEMLQDLIVAASNEALRRAQQMVNEEMSKLTGGLNIPGLGNILGKTVLILLKTRRVQYAGTLQGFKTRFVLSRNPAISLSSKRQGYTKASTTYS
jgi:DNA-binding YbaB/EbfC family protein